MNLTQLKRCIPAGAMLAAMACAQERPPVNRVQPNALPKTFFAGEDLKDIEDDPEFYMRGTLVDVGFGASQDGLFTSTYGQPVSRVRWEITENYLNARLAYERVAGTDNKGNQVEGLQRKTSNDGQIVASYEILKQFDIARQYNPTTGEELNVFEENDTDRPWYERAYIRVDWSINHATDVYDFDTLAQTGIWGGVEYEPIAYTVLDPSDADAPRFEPAEGYLDVTNKVFAKPLMADLSSFGWGIEKFPACWLEPEFAGGSFPEGSCNPVELTVRYSFRRIVDKDYEPFDYDGVRFQAFGAFNENSRRGYERNYGMVDERWFRFISRYNIWQRSHYYADPVAMTGWAPCATEETTATPAADPNADPNRDGNRNGTADECEAVTEAAGAGGSQCDVFRQRCTLPYSLREPATIPWYIGGETDEDLFEATNWATQEWSLALQSAIQVARLVECRRTGRQDCDESYPMWTGQQEDYDEAAAIGRELDVCRRANGEDDTECDALVDERAAALAEDRGNPNDPDAAAVAVVVRMQPVIVLCHNLVIEGDHPACGGVGLAPRLGDIRYNSVLIVRTPQTQEPWGIMSDGDDPLTGEKVASSVNIWADVTDYAAQALVDLVRYANGELTTAELSNGEYIRAWAEANRLAGVGAMPALSKAEVEERLAAAGNVGREELARLAGHGLPAEVAGALRGVRREARDAAVWAGAPSAQKAAAAARMRSGRGTQAEAELINPAMFQIAGVKGDMPAAAALSDAVSPLGLNNPMVRQQIRRMHEQALARRGTCILREAPEPTSVTGLADIMARKFPKAEGETAVQQKERYEKMWRYIRRQYQYGVIAHEMGHSVGHRHNFVASAGPLFYRPQYWQLRTKNGTVTDLCTGAGTDGSQCVGPRYYDPMTGDERSQLIWMFSSSSVMDYPGDVSQDMMGLGIWDYAAARMFYGDNVAVYSDTDAVRAGSRVGIGVTNATDTFGGLFGITYGVGEGGELRQIHYSELQNEYGVIKDCRAVTPKRPAWWRNDVDGAWIPVLDGKVVSVDGQYGKCRQMPVDYVAWRDLRMPGGAELGGGWYDGGPSVDKKRRLRVPYAYASDEWVDLGNASVYTHDNGADPYEIANFLITVQENRAVLDNFRRDRSTFSVRAAVDRWYERYNDKLLGLVTGMGFYANIYRNFCAAQGYTFDTLWPLIVNYEIRDNAIAASVVFDHFVRQLSRPEDGEHFWLDRAFHNDVLRSARDSESNPNDTAVVIPTGSTGYLRDVGFGGLPLENALAEDRGDFNTDYIMDAGSYYQKIYTAILLSNSEDRFISQSRGDFYDARFRAAGIPDVFPEGWRRVIANALTGDRSLLAPHVAADRRGYPLLDSAADVSRDPFARMYPARPMGWTSWWPKEGPKVCFATGGRNACFDSAGGDFDPDLPARFVPVDPEIGWEVQKFVIAWTAAFIPANQHSDWIDMLRVYRVGRQTPAGEGERRIEWQDPGSGELYYARSYGKECLFGSGPECEDGNIVEKGIAARVLEYANELTANGYTLDEKEYPAGDGRPAGFNEHGRAMFKRHPDGNPIVASDPAMIVINPDGTVGEAPADCDQNVDPACVRLTIYDNHWAWQLKGYKSVPDYLWEVLVDFQLAVPEQLGLYGD